jgi:protein N-terminal amidase
MFTDRQEIEPYLESAVDGFSTAWAIRTATRWQTHVVVGFPELDSTTTNAYNTVNVIDPRGVVVHTYRKHFLYDTDVSWATPGPDFSTVDMLACKVSVGICMDLNHSLEDLQSFYDEPFGTYVHEEQVDVVIVCMNWLLTDENEDPHSTQPSDSNLRYWVRRMHKLGQGNKRVIVIVCNRTGSERGVTFCGSTCVLEFLPRRVVLHDILSISEQAVLDVTLPFT